MIKKYWSSYDGFLSEATSGDHWVRITVRNTNNRGNTENFIFSLFTGKIALKFN